jgi:hypothetical protein
MLTPSDLFIYVGCIMTQLSKKSAPISLLLILIKYNRVIILKITRNSPIKSYPKSFPSVMR